MDGNLPWEMHAFLAWLLGLPSFAKHKRLKVKVIPLLWLKVENIKFFTGNAGPSLMSTGCPIHVLSTLPLLYYHFCSSFPTSLLRAVMVSCLDYHKSSEFLLGWFLLVSSPKLLMAFTEKQGNLTFWSLISKPPMLSPQSPSAVIS